MPWNKSILATDNYSHSQSREKIKSSCQFIMVLPALIASSVVIALILLIVMLVAVGLCIYYGCCYKQCRQQNHTPDGTEVSMLLYFFSSLPFICRRACSDFLLPKDWVCTERSATDLTYSIVSLLPCSHISSYVCVCSGHRCNL